MKPLIICIFISTVVMAVVMTVCLFPIPKPTVPLPTFEFSKGNGARGNGGITAYRFTFENQPDVILYQIKQPDGTLTDVYIAVSASGLTKLTERDSGSWE